MVLKTCTLYWTAKAKRDLKDIAGYLKKEASKEIAYKQVKSIKHCADLLETNPLLGFKEPLLDCMAVEYRSLVHGHYKIVYSVEDGTIYINSIFDCRQAPDSIKQTIK